MGSSVESNFPYYYKKDSSCSRHVVLDVKLKTLEERSVQRCEINLNVISIKDIGRFPIEIKTKIRYLIICCCLNFISQNYDSHL